MMRAAVSLLFVLVLLAPGQQALTSEVGNQACDLPEPWVGEEMAALILSRLPDPVSVLSGTEAASSSLRLQLLLWGYIQDAEAFESAVMNLDHDELLARDDDYIAGLLWLIASSADHRRRLENVEERIDALNAWSNRFVKEDPRKMFLYLMALSRVTGEETLSRMELEALDSRVPDPEMSFHIAGKLSQEGKDDAAHQKLVQAFEGGSIRALYGLGDLEVSSFAACSQRGAFYIQLFADVWSR